MKENHSSYAWRRFAARLTGIIFAVLFAHVASHAQSTLGIRLTPTVTVSGAVGSWQQIQFSDDVSNPTNWTPLTNLLLTQSPITFTDTSSGAPRRFYRSVTMALVANTNMVWIPAGTFLMGSPSNEVGRAASEGPQTLVTLTQGFFMAKFEVTQLEYLSVIGSFPATFGGGTISNSYAIKGVTWPQASGYCELLTERELASFHIPPGWAYRLPSEAEWEYACRAGSTTAFAFGNALYNSTNQGSLANFDGQQPYPPLPENDPTGIQLKGPTNVGSYPTNAFGLCDMHGSIAEWCLDGAPSATPPPYPGGSVTNPVANGSPYYVFRGGNFNSDGASCRSASRAIASSPGSTGIRVVLAPVGP